MKLRWFLSPIVAEFLIILTLLIFVREDFIYITKVIGIYLVPVAGKESIIPLAVVHYDLHPLLVGICVAQIDVVVAVFLHHNFEYSKNIPYVGNWITKFEKKNTEYFDRKPFLRKLAFLLTILFVIFPSRGSGGVGGFIFGRSIGLNGRHTLLAIILGAFVGCVGMAYFSDFISGMIPLKYVAYVLFGFIGIVIAVRFIKKLFK